MTDPETFPIVAAPGLTSSPPGMPRDSSRSRRGMPRGQQPFPAGDAPGQQPFPAGDASSPSEASPRLLTLAEAAEQTGLSAKALARRVERGTLRAVHDDQGRRVVPRAELDRAGLLDRDSPGGEHDSQRGSPAGELVIWRDLAEQRADELTAAAARERELRDDLVAIANASPIRALRLRRALRARLAEACTDLTAHG